VYFCRNVHRKLSIRFTVDPPQSRSAPGRSAPRSPQVRSFRPRFTVDPPQVLGRSAPKGLSFVFAIYSADVLDLYDRAAYKLEGGLAAPY